MEEMKLAHEILTKDERQELPLVLLRRSKFKNIVTKAIKMKDKTFANAIFIKGRPGTGKTTIVTEFLDQLVQEGVIQDYKRMAGHVTKTSLYEFMKPSTTSENVVHMFDDVDCLYDQGCLDILKAALDTKSNARDNREVYYASRGYQESFKYIGFTILITNDTFDYISPHLQAVLDRVHLMEIDLKYGDFIIFNNYILEKYLNDNPDNLDGSVINEVVTFYQTEVRQWFIHNCFAKIGINFSIRLIKKFIDLIVMFGLDWKEYSVDYKRLHAAINLPDEVQE